MSLFQFREPIHSADAHSQEASWQQEVRLTGSLIDQLEDLAAAWRTVNTVNATPAPNLSVGVARLLSSDLITSVTELHTLPSAVLDGLDDAAENDNEDKPRLNDEDEAAKLRRQALATLKSKKRPNATQQDNPPDHELTDAPTRKRTPRSRKPSHGDGADGGVVTNKQKKRGPEKGSSAKRGEKPSPARVPRVTGFDVKPGNDRWAPEPSPHLEKEEGELPQMDEQISADLKTYESPPTANELSGSIAQMTDDEVAPACLLPAEVVDRLVDIVKSNGGQILASQVVLLYNRYPGSQAVVKAVGGIKAVCNTSNKRLEFCSGVDEHGQACKGRPDSIRLKSGDEYESAKVASRDEWWDIRDDDPNHGRWG